MTWRGVCRRAAAGCRLFLARVVLCYCILSLVASPSVFATWQIQRNLFDSGVHYYNHEESSFCGPTENSASLSGEDNIAIIFNYLVGKGLTDFQAAGILGNMEEESGYEPRRLQHTFNEQDEQKALEKKWVTRVTPGDGGRVNAEDIDLGEAAGDRVGWGLVQWTPPGKMVTPLLDSGKNPNDILVQLDFLWAQLEGTGPSSEKAAGDHLKATTNVADATISFETKYERHAGPPQPSRIVEAQRILDMATNGELEHTAQPGCSTAPSDANGDAIATALLYAWPDFRGRGYIDKKPEYQAAVSRAQAEGRYVGGLSTPGVDCGGFVTLVMVDSGFEPNYNYSGKGGNTTFQQRWTRENWTTIGTVTSTAELQPGDVAFSPGHTFMYVGQQVGFETDIASAALQSRAPMAGRESIFKDHNGNPVHWYRKR